LLQNWAVWITPISHEKFGAVNQTNSQHHPSWYGQSACCVVSDETIAILIFGGTSAPW